MSPEEIVAIAESRLSTTEDLREAGYALRALAETNFLVAIMLVCGLPKEAVRRLYPYYQAANLERRKELR